MTKLDVSMSLPTNLEKLMSGIQRITHILSNFTAIMGLLDASLSTNLAKFTQEDKMELSEFGI